MRERRPSSSVISRHDFTRQLVISLTNSRFPEVTTIRPYWVSILVARNIECGMFFFVLRRGLLGANLARAPDFSRQIGWPSAGFANRLADKLADGTCR